MNGRAARFVPYLLAFFSSLCIMILELVASRLVARHVGASLSVWTSVIGIMLGGICLGNVLGGRLADRIDPRKAIGPVYALGSALVLGCLWVNALIGLIPGLHSLPLELETVLVVSLDFLIPGTVLGMIGPIVAKMAVEEARRSGGVLGDVYFMGAVGSIVGTFVAGFYLMYLAPTSTTVVLVAAALALLASILMGKLDLILGVATTAVLLIGAVLTMTDSVPGRFRFSGLIMDPTTVVGCLFALALAVRAVRRLLGEARVTSVSHGEIAGTPESKIKVKLSDLAALTFIASMVFMALEMVAGRIVTMHTGSSIYGWTSVIAVLLGGLSVGNWLGGKIANRVTSESQASWLFLVASIFTAVIILQETPPSWVVKGVRTPIESLIQGAEVKVRADDHDSFLRRTGYIDGKGWGFSHGIPWGYRVLFWVSVMFFLPSMAMGTVGPVVAKLAVDRVRARSKGMGAAIGQVYAWGMVGSILGTFLTGFFLVNVIGTKGLIVVLATVLALCATVLGSIWHAAWAGIPLGMCVIAFLPSILPAHSNVKVLAKSRDFAVKIGKEWGLREEAGNPDTDVDEAKAYIDESNYYYIKIDHENLKDGHKKRTLVLDNLIHGYFIKDQPEQLDYDYEHIYALVTHRVMQAKAKRLGLPDTASVPLSTMFLGGGSYTFPRYLQKLYPKTTADVAEIDPAVTEANHRALWLPRDTTIKTTWGDARQFVFNHTGPKYDLIFGDAFNDFSVPWHLTTREFNDRIAGMLSDDGVYMINIIDIFRSDLNAAAKGINQAEAEAMSAALKEAGAEDTMALAGRIANSLDQQDLGVDTFQLAEIARKAVLPITQQVGRAKLEAVILRAIEDAKVKVRGDVAAMVEAADKGVRLKIEDDIQKKVSEEVEKIRDKAGKDYDPVKLNALIRSTAEGIRTKARDNIDPRRVAALAKVAADADFQAATDYAAMARRAAEQVDEARSAGAFLGAWVETARKSFGDNIYVFGTASSVGHGDRETFVVVAAKHPLDLTRMGTRDTDIHPLDKNGDQVTAQPYPDDAMKAVTVRSRGIILTDDYAPVENLLAPVARTREKE